MSELNRTKVRIINSLDQQTADDIEKFIDLKMDDFAGTQPGEPDLPRFRVRFIKGLGNSIPTLSISSNTSGNVLTTSYIAVGQYRLNLNPGHPADQIFLTSSTDVKEDQGNQIKILAVGETTANYIEINLNRLSNDMFTDPQSVEYSINISAILDTP